MRRLPRGGAVDRAAPLRFSFGGETHQGLAGDTLASALLAGGLRGGFRSPLLGRPRGVMTAGPLVTFGFLVAPPLTARLVTRHMPAFSVVAAAFGAVTAFVGFYFAYRFDLPLGPMDVALAIFVLIFVGVFRGAVRAVRPNRAWEAPSCGPSYASTSTIRPATRPASESRTSTAPMSSGATASGGRA